MAKGKKRRTAPKTVPHPRYGSSFIESAYNVAEETVRDSFWGYANATIHVPSAIPADTTKQNFTVFPRGYYVDILKSCRDCKHKFIFFALEQKHWYEELGFYIDADCVRCTNCRSEGRETKMRFKRFSDSIGIDDPTDEVLETLIGDTTFLWRKEVYRNENGLRRLKNLANKRIPNCDATVEINRMVESIETDQPSE
jgi:hypothetical protein